MENKFKDPPKKEVDKTTDQHKNNYASVKSFIPPHLGIDPIPVQQNKNSIQEMQDRPVHERPDYFKPNYIQQLQSLPEEERPEKLRPNYIQMVQRKQAEEQVLQKKDDTSEKPKEEETNENLPTEELFISSKREGNNLMYRTMQRETSKGINEMGEEEIIMSVKIQLDTLVENPAPVKKEIKPVKTIKEKTVVDKNDVPSKELTPEQQKKLAERYLYLVNKKIKGEELEWREKVEMELYKKFNGIKKSAVKYSVKKETLKQIFPHSKDDVLDEVVPVFNKYLNDYGIINEIRFALFLSQVGHESMGFQKTSVTESTYYKTEERIMEIFPKYFKNKDPKDYTKKSEKLANLVYSNRMGNGSENSGDGYKYRGRGLMQLTGKDNYKKFTEFYNKKYNANEDFVTNPDKIANNVELSILSSLWYFQTRVVDTNSYKYDKKDHEFDINKEDLLGVTILVNGGVNGLKERKEILKKSKEILKVE